MSKKKTEGKKDPAPQKPEPAKGWEYVNPEDPTSFNVRKKGTGKATTKKDEKKEEASDQGDGSGEGKPDGDGGSDPAPAG